MLNQNFMNANKDKIQKVHRIQLCFFRLNKIRTHRVQKTHNLTGKSVKLENSLAKMLLQKTCSHKTRLLSNMLFYDKSQNSFGHSGHGEHIFYIK